MLLLKKRVLTLLCCILSAMASPVFAQNDGFTYDCESGPGGCSVEVESYVVNVPRDPVTYLPVSPFVYTIPGSPLDGQFKVVAQYRTRDTADANSVSFNGTAGTPVSISYGTDLTWGTSFKAEFTTGDVSTLTLEIDSDTIASNDLAALEVLVFKCTTTGGGPVTGVYPNDFNWPNVPGNDGSAERCMKRTLVLPAGSCTSERNLSMKTGVFNVHQDRACDRQIYIEYNTNDGQTFSFVEAPVENNSQIEHNIMVSAATTEIEISVCTWRDDPSNAPANAIATGDVNCVGLSHGWGYTVASDGCEGACGTPCKSPNCGGVTIIQN